MNFLWRIDIRMISTEVSYFQLSSSKKKHRSLSLLSLSWRSLLLLLPDFRGLDLLWNELTTTVILYVPAEII